MKRRSQPKRCKARGTYARKLSGGHMMYGHFPHRRHHQQRTSAMEPSNG